MRNTHKIGIAVTVAVVALLALLLPRCSQAGNQSAAFGDIVVRYSAISTDQLFAEVAMRYAIERSPHNGLVNIAIERKDAGGAPTLVAAAVSGRVADLTGHASPIRFRETRDEGAIDYLGEFPIDSSGTYVFTIEVQLPGQAQPHTVRFSRDYVLD
jgi:Domain of unknown function (DUF4426)